MAFEMKKDPEFLKDRMNFLQKLKDEGDTGGRDYLFKDKVPLFQVKDGDNTFRPMEGTWPGAKHYGYELYAHYGVGGRGQFLCLDKMAHLSAIKEACPICEEHRRAIAHNEAEYAKNIRCQHKVVIYLIDRSAESKGPSIWVMPYAKVAKPLISLQYSRRTGEFLLIDDPKEGRDVTFTKKGVKLNTDYFGIKLDFELSLSTSVAQAEEWINYTKAHPIPDLLLIRDAAYIKSVMSSGGDEAGPVIASDTARKAMSMTSAPPPVVSHPTVVEPSLKAAVTEEAKRTVVTSGVAMVTPDSGLTMKHVREMARDSLSELIVARKLDIDPAMYEADDDLKTAVLLSLGMTEE